MQIWRFLIPVVFFVLALSNISFTAPLIFFMDDCSTDQIYYSITTSAIVYSHRGYLTRTKYDFSFRCILRFTPALPKWRIAVKVLDYDLPVEPYLESTCSDNLIFSNLTLSYYNNKIAVVDERNQFASGEATYICNDMRKKHGNATLEYFSEGESQFYVGFETGSVARGGGFKLLLTAFTSAGKSESCAASRDSRASPHSMLFPCGSGPDAYCISANLTCDRMPNCPGSTKDAADEPPVRSCSTKVNDVPVTLFDKLLSLGIAASLSISIGAVLVLILCIVASVCLCRRFVCREKKRRASGSCSGANYTSGGPYCSNSRTGSAVGGAGGSFVSASQRSQFIANTTVNSGGGVGLGPYHMYTNGSSLNGGGGKYPGDHAFRPMSPSRLSENVASSVGGGTTNFWVAQQGAMYNVDGNGALLHPNGAQQHCRVQYMAAPRHFASPLPIGYLGSSANESASPYTTRPSQVSSSGFGGSQTQALPPFNVDGLSASDGPVYPMSLGPGIAMGMGDGIRYHPSSSSAQQSAAPNHRSTTPSSNGKSARSNGAASSYANNNSAQQPFLPQGNSTANGHDDDSAVRDESRQAFIYYAKMQQQQQQQQVNL